MIDWFMGGKPKKKSKDPLFDLMNPKAKKKKGKNPLASLMIKPNTKIIGDKITKPQRRAMKINPFSDWDGDRVINGLDCAPRNKRKHNYQPKTWEEKVNRPDRNSYQKTKLERDEAIEREFQERGYYKYKGNNLQQKDDLESSSNLFRDNPINNYIKNTQGRTSINLPEKHAIQSLWHAGDQHPTATLRTEGRVYGFSDKRFAEGWKEKHGKKHLFRFQTSEYDLDDKNYMRKTPQGEELSDNEFIAYNIHNDKMHIPINGDYITKEQRNVLKSGQDRFTDTDKDGVIDGLDCKPNNPKRHSPNMFTFRPEDEDPEEVYPSEPPDRMDIGRGTGWTGTGIYGYTSEGSARKEKYAYDRMDYNKGPRKLKKIWSEKPKELDFGYEYDAYERTSKDLYKLKMEQQFKKEKSEHYSEEDERELKSSIKRNMSKIGEDVSDSDIRYAISRDEKEQPINHLMRRKGYDAIFADSSNDTYRKGSVYFGDKERIKNKLKNLEDGD